MKNSTMLEVKIAGLTTRCVPARGGSVTNADSLIVLLHGYGAAGDDLVYLGEELELAEGTVLVFPEGPLDLSDVTGREGSARGWWPTDSKQYQLAMLTGRAALASNAAGLGRQAARAVFGAFIRELQSRFHVGPHRVVLGGFSQGAILCLDWALHDGDPWAGLLCLSGTLIEGCDWARCLATRSPLRVLVSHGRYDPILPFLLAQELHLHLQNANWDAEFLPFDGTHSIPSDVIRAVSSATMRWLHEAPGNRAESTPACCATPRAAHSKLERNPGSSA